MEKRKTDLQIAREQYLEALTTANRMHKLACEEADRQHDLFLQPFREALERARTEAKKEVVA